MINYLPEMINQYSTSSRATVSSLIRYMKVGKSDLSALIARVSNTTIDQNFTAADIPMFSVLSKEIMIDSFRNMFLRIQSFFSASNATGIALNSMIDIFSSEIEKIESDLDKMQLFVDNYEFISGKDDLYNANYVEKFDSLINDYRSDNIILSIPDRDGKAFPDGANAYVDSKSGFIKIGKTQTSKNIIKNVKSIKIKDNYDNYITTKTNFETLFNDSLSDSWNITIKSPTILTAQISDYNKYLNYDYSNIIGARTAVEVELSVPISIDTIRFNSNDSNNFSLLQVVVFNDNPLQIQPNTQASSENYSLLLNSSIFIKSTLDISFDKRNINKIIFIFNQNNYIKSNKIPIKSELNSKVLDSFVRAVINDRKSRFSKYQDIVFWFFKRKNFISEVSKNKYFDTDYYTYRFPQEFDSYISNLNKQIKEFNSLVIEDRNIYTNTPVFINLMNNMLDSFTGSMNLFKNDKFIERLSESSVVNSLSDPLFMGSGASNSINYKDQAVIESISNIPTSIVNSTLSLESEDIYEYSFSIKSIEFIETMFENTMKAAYVSKKIPINGQILAVKAKVNAPLNAIDSPKQDVDLLVTSSYEISISNKAAPNMESDWIPIAPYGSQFIDSEVLFLNSINKKAELRFFAISDSINLYKDGIIVPKGSINYTYNPQLKTISISDTIYSASSMFIVSYKLDYTNYSPDEIDFIKNNIYIESIKSYSSNGIPGEIFSQTDNNSVIKLSYSPYINKNAVSQATYNKMTGTNFNEYFSGYSPVKVQLSDGAYALNITNYTSSVNTVQFYSTNNILFIHTGNRLVFNRNINTPFKVFYEYTPNDLRFRLIMRKNFIDTNQPTAVDSVIVKMKTLDYDPFYDKINSIIN